MLENDEKENNLNGVLILPYWNVNQVITILSRLLVKVLILPYWNVNMRNLVDGRDYSGFNLTLLECKS